MRNRMIGILCFYNGYWCCLVCVKHIVCKLRFLSMHKITMKANFTIGKFDLLFHVYTILWPFLACDGFVNIAELDILFR